MGRGSWTASYFQWAHCYAHWSGTKPFPIYMIKKFVLQTCLIRQHKWFLQQGRHYSVLSPHSNKISVSNKKRWIRSFFVLYDMRNGELDHQLIRSITPYNLHPQKQRLFPHQNGNGIKNSTAKNAWMSAIINNVICYFYFQYFMCSGQIELMLVSKCSGW